MVFRGAFICAAVGVMVLFAARNVIANDSFAVIKAGGLELKKSDGIVMESEDLYLSPSEVRVKYVFRNETQGDIPAVVAFSVPKMDTNMEYSGNTQFLTDPDPFKFKVLVDGKPVLTKMEKKETKPGVFSLAYYWTQNFPKGKRLNVEHLYKPMVGGFLYDLEYTAPDAIRKYCIDPPLRSTLSKLIKKDNPNALLLATELSYILSTGSNWKGPIKDFRMVIDKEKPERLASLCIDGIKKIDTTRFEVKKENFVPKGDIDIVFFDQPPRE